MTIGGHRKSWIYVAGLLTVAMTLGGCGDSTQTGAAAASAVSSDPSSTPTGVSGKPVSPSSGVTPSSSSSGGATSCAASPAPCGSIAASLFSTPDHESPVRADPDDLLLLPGINLSSSDTVVYQAVTNTAHSPAVPAAIPAANTARSGIADLVSVGDAPYSLTIHLPSVMLTGQAYALWVVDADGNWSNSVLINDARPLWISPDFSYQSASIANLPRILKVVGRNMQPVSASVGTQVRLLGPSTYTLTAIADSAVTTGAVDPVAAPQIARYVAKVQLPTGIAIGSYSIQVSRDGGNSWVALMGENGNLPQTLHVLADPVSPPSYYVHNYGCKAGDGSNALACVVNAIHDAQTAGGGAVIFDAGVWNLELPNTEPFTNCLFTPVNTISPAVTCDGIIVPPKVNLQGAVSANSAQPATIVKGRTWALATEDGQSGVPLFNLQGNNTVSNLYFSEQFAYTPFDTPGFNNGEVPAADLRLGVQFWHAPGGDGPGSGGYYNVFTPTSAITHVIITGNVFDKPFTAIDSGGLPIDHLMITDNTFGGAFSNAIYINQNANNIWLPFRNDDSIVAFNSFYPSSYYQYTDGTYQGNTVPINTAGPIATQIGTGLRVDFSNNIADGRSTTFFYDQSITPINPSGWRAAFFWNTGNDQELTLVSENQAFCSGDKAGDGEAIAYDSVNPYGGLLDITGNSAAALRVVASAAWTDPNTRNPGSTITAQGALVDPVPSHQTMPSIPAARYYPGQWLQIIQGAGVGQWRKIISVAAGSNAASATIAFNVVPALDVLPTMSQPNNSVVTVGTAFWQNLTVDNVSDQSLSRGCTKLNQDYVNPSGSFLFPQLNMGAMVWWGSAADSAMEGNELKDSGGIGLYHYFAPAVSGQTKSYTILKSSDTVRSNVISGQYDFTSPFSGGGISIPSGATAAPGYANAWNPTDPPVTAFGITIAGNSISQAASSNFTLAPRTAMGAIAVGPGLDASGPADANGQRAWKMANATLIFHNTLSNMSGGRLNRVGVGIASARTDLFETWRSVLYANNCSMQTPISDYGISTVRYCPTQASGSCECAAVSAIDIGVSASSSSSQVAVGNAVSFTVTVTNHDPSATATGVALSLESSAGIQIASMTVTSGTGVCNLSVNVCQLGTATFGTPGSLAPSTSQQVTVTGTAVGAGTWPTSFSVTHQDADPVVSNNGVTLSTLVQ